MSDHTEPGRIIRLTDDDLTALKDGNVVACFNPYSTRQAIGAYTYVVQDGTGGGWMRDVVVREEAEYVNELLAELGEGDE